jgi:predicted MPP superfamily phosphohydrolase
VKKKHEGEKEGRNQKARCVVKRPRSLAEKTENLGAKRKIYVSRGQGHWFLRVKKTAFLEKKKKF